MKELSIEQQQEMDKVVTLLKNQNSRLEKEYNESVIIHRKAIEDLKQEIARLIWVSDDLSRENEELKKENQDYKEYMIKSGNIIDKLNEENKLLHNELMQNDVNISNNLTLDQLRELDKNNNSGYSDEEYEAYARGFEMNEI
ncbi:hypothetical protein DVV91_09860 [Clostridium botulinum]|uniref:hypothetical protein n=1 Tax=Clostridium botulinum TaxID=1491 RepID=UPI001967759B|nr:hypothetical protein [Clostridium botulinum]MBN1074645.1 hypothetical protein [Clostridium botulinum]